MSYNKAFKCFIASSTTLFALFLTALATPSSADVYAAENETPAMRQVKPALERFRAKIEKGESVDVAYFGGSITAADGWRVQTLK